MKMNFHFRTLYILLLVCQIILCNYSNFGPYVILSILPAMVLCIPLSVSTPLCMFIAFVSGISVDWLSEGLIGLNASSILPVALIRKGLISMFIGEDLISRSERFSIRKNGFTKVFIAYFCATSIFLAIYILLDGAGTRPFLFILTRFGVSLACCLTLGLFAINTLTAEEKK